MELRKIDREVYLLFLEHGSECFWRSDSRVQRPEGTTPETDKMFDVLERLDHQLEMLSIEAYDTKMKRNFQTEIMELKSKVSDEVFELMNKAYN